MIIALFGDVHGNLDGMYALCREWECARGTAIDLVLQTGDMGLWTRREQVDAATRRHLQGDPSELGGAPYLEGRTPVPIETWFVHGNHEDFDLLREREGMPLDPMERLVFLSPGTIRHCRKGGESVTIASLGGMEYRFGRYPPPTGERVQKYLDTRSMERLMEAAAWPDILLLHDAPLNKGLRDRFPTGSSRITRLIEALQPRFAFYGHYHDPPEPFTIGRTLCACLNSRGARRIPGRDGAMGILSTGTWEFSFVEA